MKISEKTKKKIMNFVDDHETDILIAINVCATGFKDALVQCAKESGDNIAHVDMSEILKIKTEGA